jgi:hypothetical protein
MIQSQTQYTEVKNDDIVYYVFSKNSGGWEEVEVENLVQFGEDPGAP